MCCYKYRVDCFGSLRLFFCCMLKCKSRNITKHLMSGPLGNQLVLFSRESWCQFGDKPNKQTPKLPVPNIQTGGSLYLIAICFWNSKTISHLKFERLLITDFCSNDFSEISLVYLLYQWKMIPEISLKNISKMFY